MQRKKTYSLLFGGGAIGLINGILGGGGGMIAVPLLQRAADYPPRQAHATAIAVILPASLFSGAVYLFHGLVPLSLYLPVALGVLTGGFLGAKLLAKSKARAVALVFAIVMMAAGVRMLF